MNIKSTSSHPHFAPSLQGRAGVGLLLLLLPLFASAESFSKMWKRVQTAEEAGKPKTAYSITQEILTKAEREQAKGQLICARLRGAALRQEWAPDSFFTDIRRLEAARAAETETAARAVYASVLAELYQNNSRRSQARGLQLKSSDIKEWTQEQYDSAAAANYRLSLSEPVALARAKSADWMPFVTQGKQSAYFKHDLLHVLWARVRDNFGNEKASQLPIANYISIYRSQKNRDAEMLMMLDSINLQPTSKRSDAIIGLTKLFRDRPVCVEAYISLIQNSTDSTKVKMAEEALRLYPKYERINVLRERINDITQPKVILRTAETYYPGKSVRIPVEMKNVAAVTFDTYLLNASFSEKQYERSPKQIKYLQANATRIDRLRHVPSQKQIYRLFTDTVTWKAPKIGRYAILITAETANKNVSATTQEEVRFFTVSALHMLYRSLENTRLANVIVVDAESGSPVEGASVKVFTEKDETRSLDQTIVTDSEGRASFKTKNRSITYILSASKGEDKYLPERNLWTSSYSAREEKSQQTVRLFSDRSIYRPGQTVRVSGIAYEQLHWETNVLADKEIRLTLYDTNRKEVSKQTVRTDSMGVVAADFSLPPSCLPGSFSITGDLDASLYFTVEEYKRPTFEVKMDKAPALSWPQDSITITGRALGYNGVPVRQGRVAGRYRRTYPYVWWRNQHSSSLMHADTVETDDEGRFSVRLPLKGLTRKQLEDGFVIALDVAVTNPAGETREGSSRIPICTKPLRLSISMPSKQERTNLKPVRFNAISSTGEPAQAEISWRIERGDKSEAVAWSSGDPLTALAALPSGSYKMYAIARNANDSAKAEQSFYLFSMEDTRLPSPKEFWFYCPSDTFDVGHPALLQVGSSLRDVSLYYSILTTQGEQEKKLILFSDSVLNIEIPYTTTYGDGVSVNLFFVKGGEVYSRSQHLLRALPDKRLKWEWRTFRDKLHPGDKETWTLRLTRPDGKPANANMMATIYDASLDALRGHSWLLSLYRSHNIVSYSWNYGHYWDASQYIYMSFPNKPFKYTDFSLDCFDPQWTEGLSFMSVYGGRRLTRATGDKVFYSLANFEIRGEPSVEEAAVLREAPAALMAKASPKAVAIEDRIQEDGEGEQTVSPAAGFVRTNFNETAAFLPRLHTDRDGVVTLQFTLPESLTTWHLLGLAHTDDMDVASIEAEAVARKEMMAQLYMPRFLRAGDKATLTASIQNLTEKPISGRATLEIFNPETERVISRQKASFEAKANGEQVLTFQYEPKEPGLLAVRLSAESKSFSDGEQHYLPVLSDKEWITETVEIKADSAGTFTTDLTSLFNKNSKTATNRRLTVEYTSHPIWYAIQALPALREPRFDDALSVATNFYANRLAVQIAKSEPRIKSIVEIWQREEGTPSLKSRLQEDEELKNIILDETPWLREAENNAERKRRLIELFNDSYQQARLESAIAKLRERQNADGSFSWFPGMRGSEYITRNVTLMLTRLKTLCGGELSVDGSSVSKQAENVLSKAVGYLASETAKDVVEMRKAEKKGEKIVISSLARVHYLYISQHAGYYFTTQQQTDIAYLLKHMSGSVAEMDNETRAVSAIVMQTEGRKKEAESYLTSLKEHMTSTNRGTFFDYASGSFTSINRKLHTHTAAMEAVCAVTPSDKTLQSQMRRWLLSQKRTQMWNSPIESADAIYALLQPSASKDQPSESQPSALALQPSALAPQPSALAPQPSDRLILSYQSGKKTTLSAASTVRSGSPASSGASSAFPSSAPSSSPSSTAALGYIKQQIEAPAPVKSITVERRENSEAWGAVYAQYLTPVADVSAQTTGLSVRREFSTLTPSKGDALTIRYVITADRDYEYVCLSAERPACAEPAEQASGYRWQSGLGYYRAVRDARTEYFFDRLPKGTYVLEERFYTDRSGTYSAGLCRLQSLYAPEYNAHTTGAIIKVK